jgi:RNA polymerase sigma factor (sigma-70 family)
MSDIDWLAEQFEQKRPHLRAVAYRMLGSLPDAEDAVQEAWLRLSRSDASDVDNLGGWLTTVVGRIALDMLRTRTSRREDALTPEHTERLPAHRGSRDPEQELLLANSVGLALLVILDTLEPAERLAFVLHDMFGLSFEDVAPIVERSPDAARQLASRARRRVQGSPTATSTDLARKRSLVDAYLAAARSGDFDALMSLLDPDIVLHADHRALPGGPAEIRDAAAIAHRAIKAGARAAQPALVNGDVGLVIAPRGKLLMVLTFTIARDRIVGMEAIADPDRLHELKLSVLPQNG